jgi:hypothetical protein
MIAAAQCSEPAQRVNPRLAVVDKHIVDAAAHLAPSAIAR